VNKNFFQKAWDTVFAVFNKNWFTVGILGFSILVITMIAVCCYLRCRTKKVQEEKGKDGSGAGSESRVDASNMA
jgi:hypothetical protein